VSGPDLIAVSASIGGAHPLDPAAWSGSASRLFGELDRRGRLRGALGIRPPLWEVAWPALRTLHPDRARWRSRLSFEPAYRRAATAEAKRRLRGLEGDLLQLGAYFDGVEARAGRGRSIALHDGNLAVRLASPYPIEGVSSDRLQRALREEAAFARSADLILTLSEWLRASFIRDYGVAPDRVTSIGGGVNFDAPPAPCERMDKDYDRPELAFVGVDFPRKGGPDLLAAFRAVRAARPDARLHLIGPPRKALPQPLAGGVVQHGFLPKAAMRAVFARCCLFVMPSRFEPFGVAPLEAMACGLPAVVSGAWALAETVRPGVTGAHVRPQDPDDLAATLLELLGAPERLARMGAAAQAEALSRFSWSAVADRLEQALRARFPA